MEFYFDLTDLITQDAKTATLKSDTEAVTLCLVDNAIDRSSPRVETRLHPSIIKSETVYSEQAAINMNSSRAISRAITPREQRSSPLIQSSSRSSIKENIHNGSLATSKTDLTLRPSAPQKPLNPFGRPTRQRSMVEPKLQMTAIPVKECPDNWIPSHTCDDFCKTLLII